MGTIFLTMRTAMNIARRIVTRTASRLFKWLRVSQLSCLVPYAPDVALSLASYTLLSRLGYISLDSMSLV